MSNRVEAAVDAVDAFLQDGTYGLNVQLGLLRTELGITTAELPDVAEWSKWAWRPEKVTKYPHGNIYASETRAEVEDNSRMYEVDFDLTFVLNGKAVGGTVEKVVQALWRIFDALQDLMNRRNSGSEGVNLAMGASGRVLFALLGRARVGALPDQSGRMNQALQATLTVMMIEDW